MKTCSKCKEDKELDQFFNCSSTKDKLKFQCKSCESEYHKGKRDAKNLIKEQQFQEYLRIGIKTCTKCKIPQPFSNYHNRIKSKDGYAFECISCWKQYNIDNKERIQKTNKIYNKLHKEDIDLYNKEYKSQEEVKEKMRKRVNARYREDILYRLKIIMNANLNACLKRGKFVKKSRTFEVLGCSYEELKSHFESLFESWMNWENQGLFNNTPNFGWDVDHIIPTSSAKTEEELIKLNHYTNLQPLCSYINRIVKRDRLDYEKN